METLNQPSIGQKLSKIELIGGTLIIDEADYLFVSRLGLSIVRRGHLEHVYINTQPYYKQALHRVLLKINDPDVIVDHEDRNGLNNSRINLRVTNKVGNALNMRVNINKKSKLPKGVYNERGEYKAQIKVNFLEYYLGHFKTIPEAEAAYNKALDNYWKNKPIRS